MLAVAIAPGPWVGPTVGPVFDRGHRVESPARRVDANKLSHRIRAMARAHQGEHERYGHAHDREFDDGVARARRQARVFATQIPNWSGSLAEVGAADRHLVWRGREEQPSPRTD